MAPKNMRGSGRLSPASEMRLQDEEVDNVLTLLQKVRNEKDAADQDEALGYVTSDKDRLPSTEMLWKLDPAPEAVRGPTGKVYRGRSFFCLSAGHEPRRVAIGLCEWPLFDKIILITILCNVFTMAWQSPLDPPGTWKAEFIGQCEQAAATAASTTGLHSMLSLHALLLPDMLSSALLKRA